MKNFLHSLTASIAASLLIWLIPVAATAQIPAVTVQETEREFVISANFVGGPLPDVVLVDRVSGAFRIGEQTASGTITWGQPLASGIANVSAVAAGLILSPGHYTLAVTSPEANRIHLLDLTSANPVPRPLYVPNRIGPFALASGQISGSDPEEDLIVATSLNNSPNQYTLGHYNFGLDGSANPVLLGVASSTLVNAPEYIGDLHRVAISNAIPEGQSIGYLIDDGSDFCLRVVSIADPSFPILMQICGMPVEARYHLVRFGGAAIGGVVVYVPGDNFFTYHALSPSGSAFTASAGTNIALPFAIGSMSPIKGDGVVRLAITEDDGSAVHVYNFAGGVLSPVPVQSFTAGSGAPIATVLPVANSNGIALFTMDPDSGRIAGTQFAQWLPGDGSFNVTSSAALDFISPRAGMANVSLMSGEPFVDTSAHPIMLRNTRDWTSGTPPALPGPVTVTAETFDSEPVGLTDPQVVNLGASPASANFALLNQYADPISIFTLSRASGSQAGQVGISPAPGVYDRSIELRFNSSPTGLLIAFRDQGGQWQLFVDPGPEPDPSDPSYAAWFADFSALVRYKETTIEYFGLSFGGTRTPIRTAHFRFSEPPDTLSTLGDGVPDYAKLGLGINPFRLPDGDASSGIGNSLQAILDGSGIDPRHLSGSAVDVYVRPLAHDGNLNPASPSRLATNPLSTLPDGTLYGGNQIFARTLGGALIGQGRDPIPATTDRNEGLGIYAPHFAQASAYLATLSGEASGVYVLSTRPNFALTSAVPAPPLPSSVGREIIGLLSLDQVSQPAYTRTYSGGTLSSEANAWRTGSEAFYSANPPPVVTRSIDTIETMAALLFERWLQLRMVERELLPVGFVPPTPNASTPSVFNDNYLSLTGHRTSEGAQPLNVATEGAVTATPEALRALSQWDPVHPTYSLAGAAEAIRDYVRNSATPGVVALRAVATDVYRINAAHANSFPGAFEAPIDALRTFIATGGLPEPYTPGYGDLAGAPFTTLPAGTYTSAVSAIAMTMAVPNPRPSSWIQVEFRADSLDYPGCLVVNEAFMPATLFSLFNGDGRAFRIPSNFSVLPGTRIHINVFEDAPFTACVGSALEVIEFGGSVMADVQVLPTATGDDQDGNLLGDDWEEAFFGATGADPWYDSNGDGYTYLQKYLDGKDPFLPPSYAASPPAFLELPALYIDSTTPGQVVVTWDFPDPYGTMLNFSVWESATLGGSWLPAAYPVLNPSPGEYEVTIPFGGGSPAFWQIGLSLP